MPSLLTHHYRSQLVLTYLEKIRQWEVVEALVANGSISASMIASVAAGRNPATVLYVFAGRPQEWVDAANATVSDSAPPVPVDTVKETTFDTWHNMLIAKRVYSSNTAYIATRYDWVAGTVYDQYDDQDDMLMTKMFYVLDTSDVEYRVYKCLWNAQGGSSTNSPSLIIGTNPTATLLPDGYTWKFMYAMPSNDKFLAPNWIPVYANSVVVTAAQDAVGALSTSVPLLVIDGGANYNSAVGVTTTVRGDGSGATSSSLGGTTIVGGQVDRVLLATGGNNYSRVTSVNVYQLGATSANVRAIIPPYPNHGADPIVELGVSHAMVHCVFTSDEGGKLTVNNDYRQIGFLMNPVSATTGRTANLEVYQLTYNLTLASNTGPFLADDLVYNFSISANTDRNYWGVPSGTVVDVVEVDGSYVVRLTDVNAAGHTEPFAPDDVVKCSITSNEGVVNTYSSSELVPYSGHACYINQRTPIFRDIDQSETFKVILPFGG